MNMGIAMRTTLVLALATTAHAFRTSYAARPGKLLTWGRDNYMNCLGPNATQKGCAPTPSQKDFVAVAAGKDLALGLRSNGVAVAWGLNKIDARSDLAKAQPLDASGNLKNADDAFTMIACGRGGWLARKVTGHLVTGGGYNRGEAGTPTKIPIPDEFEKILDEQLPKGGQVVAMGGGGGTFCVALRRWNESAYELAYGMDTGGKGGRLYAWNDVPQGGWEKEPFWSSTLRH